MRGGREISQIGLGSAVCHCAFPSVFPSPAWQLKAAALPYLLTLATTRTFSCLVFVLPAVCVHNGVA